jgi:hypothetical protein
MLLQTRLLKFFLLGLAGCSVWLHAQSVPEVTNRGEGKSVAEAARENQKKKQLVVRVRPEDAQKLFASMDEILQWVGTDTGYGRHGAVSRKLLSHGQFQEHFAGHPSQEEEQQYEQLMQRSELVSKKFGLLPPNYSLTGYASQEPPIAAFYSPKDKTMYLLDWVPLQLQKHIMAHELTHALQDQNFDLGKFLSLDAAKRSALTAPTMTLAGQDASEWLISRRAVGEGQATLVEAEYVMHQLEEAHGFDPPEGFNEKALDYLRNRLENYDRAVYIHSAPRMLQESLMFPYREGAIFELEVLRRSGRKAAFAGTFARPPISTHEILEPDAYLSPKRMRDFAIPDLRPLLGAGYEPFDTGSMGEWDIHVMAEEFGRDNDLYSVVPFWNGGGYIAVKKAGAKGTLTTADLALVYVSQWKSPQAAKRFAQIYKAALPKRLTVLSEKVLEPPDCEEGSVCLSPLWAARVVTSEGPVYIEVWPGNQVFISHSFDDQMVSQLRQYVLHPPDTAQMLPLRHELSMRLFQIPVFADLQERVGGEFREHMLDAFAYGK